MKAHNGTVPRAQWKAPPGYVSAKAKAYAAWKEKQGKSTKVTMLMDGDVEIDSEDESDADSGPGFTINAVTRSRGVTSKVLDALAASPDPVPTVVKNSFDALRTFDDDETSAEVLKQLGGWAHKVKTTRPAAPKKAPNVAAPKKVRLISSSRELSEFMKQNPKVAQVPTERKQLSKVMKILTSKINLEEGETLVLMDSGSTINVAKIKKHFAKYADMVVPSSGSINGETATTACGKKLVNRGKCLIKGKSDGQNIAIPFQDMDVELPIVSVRKCVKSGNDVSFFEGGGELRDRASDKTIRIYELEGTYVMKLKVDGPEDESAFGRPGR